MLDIESLLVPLSDDAPSGADLEYDATFLSLEAAGAGRPEQQYGDTIIAAEPPDWSAVREHALELARRTRDLRVGVWLARSGARVSGLAGAVDGLQLIAGLLQQRWDDVHPQLDASEGNDPTMRMNALAPLGSPEAFIADFRSSALIAVRGSVTVRDIELGLGLAEALDGESVPSDAGIVEAVGAAMAQDTELAGRLGAAARAVQAIVETIESHVGAAGAGPDLQMLVRLAGGLDRLRLRLEGSADAEGEPQPTTNAGASPGLTRHAGPGVIASRDDVVRTLDSLCQWIEQNEPSNPAPLLLRRAQRLMSKSFMDIVRDLAPESVGQIERLAGVESGSE